MKCLKAVTLNNYPESLCDQYYVADRITHSRPKYLSNWCCAEVRALFELAEFLSFHLASVVALNHAGNFWRKTYTVTHAGVWLVHLTPGANNFFNIPLLCCQIQGTILSSAGSGRLAERLSGTRAHCCIDKPGGCRKETLDTSKFAMFTTIN